MSLMLLSILNGGATGFLVASSSFWSALALFAAISCSSFIFFRSAPWPVGSTLPLWLDGLLMMFCWSLPSTTTFVVYFWSPSMSLFLYFLFDNFAFEICCFSSLSIVFELLRSFASLSLPSGVLSLLLASSPCAVKFDDLSLVLFLSPEPFTYYCFLLSFWFGIWP